MAHTFSRVLVHLVFSTKSRLNLIEAGEMQTRLHGYLAGVVGRHDLGHAIRIGGIANHLHALVDISPKHAVAEVVRQMKTASTGWANDTFHLPTKFAWQSGYGSFSVSESAREAVVAYIDNQEARHRRLTFEDEYLQLVKKHNLPVDERFIFG